MIISFTGAQSTGKTTLLTKCQSHDFWREFEFVPEVTRLVKRKYNVEINEDGNNLTQLCIINQHIENSLTLKGKNAVLDRCILDGVVYTEYLYRQGKVDRWVWNYAKKVFDEIKDEVDIIFYTCPEFPIVDDGERSTNKKFRDDILKLFAKYRKKLTNVVELKGTVEDRYDTIIADVLNLELDKLTPQIYRDVYERERASR